MLCDPSDLIHFRKSIGEKEVEKIFKLSIEIHGEETRKKYQLTQQFRRKMQLFQQMLN